MFFTVGKVPSEARTNLFMNNFLNKFRDPALVEKIVGEISKLADQPQNYMEVCGTHTMSIAQYGLRSLLPKTIRLLSGPGCPVCVTSQSDIETAIAFSRLPDVIIATFGDLLRVPAKNNLSLEKVRAEGAAVKIVYSPWECLKIAEENPEQSVIFIGVGFETTTPLIAATVVAAEQKKIKNFFVLPFFKLVPPALEFILSLPKNKIDGFILPGHVSAVIGSYPYAFVAEKYHCPAVISGFEPTDILKSILMLLQQKKTGVSQIQIQYLRGVKPGGNSLAQETVKKVFRPTSAHWRAIGQIAQSGLEFNPDYAYFDAQKHFTVEGITGEEVSGCRCGEILLGLSLPAECPFFGQTCQPSSPLGPCMVSSEGACAAYYKYGT